MNDTYIKKEIEIYRNNTIKMAFMLDGVWGCGKTYFVSNNISNSIYISLYGKTNISSLVADLIMKLSIKKKCKNRRADNVINEVSEIVFSMLDTNKKIIDKTAKLFSFLDFDKKILIFDDLERTSINLDELFGFINNLVEHSNTKVLLVANESAIIESNKEKACYYKTTKEKIIYKTLKYVPDLDNIYNKIIGENDIFINSKDFVIEFINRKNHINIRTLQFIKQIYEDFIKSYNDIINMNDFFDNKNYILESIFQSFVVASVLYKNNGELPIFENDEDISYYNYEIDKHTNVIKIFKFVNEYIEGQHVTDEEIKRVIAKFVSNINSNTTNENSNLYIISSWWEREDDDIKCETNKVIELLKNDKIDIVYYYKLLIFFLYVNDSKVMKIDIKNIFEYMKKNINNNDGILDISKDFMPYINENIKKEYLSYDIKLNECIKNHNIKFNNTKLDLINKNVKGEIGTSFYNYIDDERSKIIISKSLFSVVDYNILVHLINKGNNYDLRKIMIALGGIYNFSNVATLYPGDNIYLKKLLNNLKKQKNSTSSKIKKYTFDLFIDELENILSYYDEKH